MKRIFIAQPHTDGGGIVIDDPRQVHYLSHVLRVKTQDALTVFDRAGTEYDCLVREVSKEWLRLSVTASRTPCETGMPRVTIACALPKQTKFDDIVDKLTQLGVSRIIPMRTRRVIVKVDAAKERLRQQRWEKIAVAACEQSKRASLPLIDPVTDFNAVVNTAGSFSCALIPWLEGERIALAKAVPAHCRDILVLIGPEGDFTPEEAASAMRAGCRAVSLGESVLRVDTAAIAVMSFLRCNAYR
jgi:16S rRNA (uracil1498-N3)-methyltransferase